jgi:hypothetical protein
MFLPPATSNVVGSAFALARRSAIKDQPMLLTYFDLTKCYLKLDIPNTALDLLQKAGSEFLDEPRLTLGMARIYDMLADTTSASAAYKRVLQFDAANVEAMACLAANHFYEDGPEIGLRYYRRLLQMGVNSCEVRARSEGCERSEGSERTDSVVLRLPRLARAQIVWCCVCLGSLAHR